MPRYDKEWLAQILARPGYKLSAPVVAPVLHDPLPKRTGRAKPLADNQAKGGGPKRFKVRLVRCSERFCDPDNLAGAKLLIDELRYARLIPEDNPEAIELELCQMIVPRKQRGTLIEIERIAP